MHAIKQRWLRMQHRRFVFGSCSVCCRSTPSRRGTCGQSWIEQAIRRFCRRFVDASWERRIGYIFTKTEAHHHDDRAEGKSSGTTSPDGRSVQIPPMSDGGSGNDTTFQDMQRKRLQIPVAELPQEVFNFHREVPVNLDRKTFLSSLKSAPRGSSPGPGGWTYEHLKGMLDDTDTFEWFLSASNSLSQARVPNEIAEALMGARMTALTKPDGCVRSIATGGSLRRFVARQLAKQSVRDKMCALPVRLVHQGGDRLRRAHVARSNGRKTNCDHPERGWDRSLMSTGLRCGADYCACPLPGHSRS